MLLQLSTQISIGQRSDLPLLVLVLLLLLLFPFPTCYKQQKHELETRCTITYIG